MLSTPPTVLRPLKLSHLRPFLHCMVLSLCNQLLLRFSKDLLEPCKFVVDIMKICMWVSDGARINFDRITAF